MPSVFFDVINVACLDLDFLDVIIPSKSVDELCTNAYSREKADLAQHGCSVIDILVYVLKTVVTHASKKEPRTDVFVLLLCYR